MRSGFYVLLLSPCVRGNRGAACGPSSMAGMCALTSRFSCVAPDSEPVHFETRSLSGSWDQVNGLGKVFVACVQALFATRARSWEVLLIRPVDRQIRASIGRIRRDSRAFPAISSRVSAKTCNICVQVIRIEIVNVRIITGTVGFRTLFCRLGHQSSRNREITENHLKFTPF